MQVIYLLFYKTVIHETNLSQVIPSKEHIDCLS